MSDYKKSGDDDVPNTIPCPICNKDFDKSAIQEHANKCLFLNTSEQSKFQQKAVHPELFNNAKRSSSHLKNTSSVEKRTRLSTSPSSSKPKQPQCESSSKIQSKDSKNVPLAEQMRPISLQDIVGHTEAFGSGSMLRSLLEQRKIPNMILWGPPGCGKTSLANVISNICKEQNNMRFVKLSATMSGINDVKEVVKVAKNEAQFKRQTILFMDEIHRFNKLQQDTFLPHVENGTIILIGATTENPSFSLNNALLSRCRVVVMQKLSIEDVLEILKKALTKTGKAAIKFSKDDLQKASEDDLPNYRNKVPPEFAIMTQMCLDLSSCSCTALTRVDHTKYLGVVIDDGLKWCIVEEESLQWLAEVSDGDARVALGALEIALDARDPGTEIHVTGPAVLTLEDIKNGIKRTHMMYDRQGEEHYNTISAVHKSIRAGDDNAALYWTTRALQGGEDPLYIARRLVRAACEDIGLAEPNAIVEAVACLQGCQQLGMPECDVLLVQCAVRLARAPKSTEVYRAMRQCQKHLAQAKGPLPPVPLHLRNAPTKLMKQLGYASGYNLLHKDESGLEYMPEGMEDCNFFQDV